MWNLEATEALGTNLWHFSFDDSVRQLRLGAHPWKGRETKNHLNRSKSTQKAYQNQINIRMKQGNMVFILSRQ